MRSHYLPSSRLLVMSRQVYCMQASIERIMVMLLAWLVPMVVFTQKLPRFQESEGIVIIEIESAEDYSSWEIDTNRLGFTGDGYLQYKGSNLFNDPGKSLLNFEIVIDKTGKYRFQWHSLIAVGDSNTEHNDSWLRFSDASDFYGEKDGAKVYSKGVGKSPNPPGSSARRWFIIHQNNSDGWTGATRTSDHNPHQIFVEFDTAGIYTLEVSGRSNGHAINRLALFHSDVNASMALDLSRPESDRLETVSVNEAHFRPLQVRPTLADRVIYLDLPPSVNSGVFKEQVINGLGQSIQTLTLNNVSGGEVAVPIDQLVRGHYWIRIRKESIYFQGKFVKQ